MVERDPKAGLGIGAAGPGLEVDAPAVEIADLVAAARAEFDGLGEEQPPPEELLALVQVIAGHLRTSADVGPIPDEITREQAVASFVGASLGESPAVEEEYADVPVRVRAGLAEHGARTPAVPVVDVLARIATGLLRRRSVPQARAAQIAAVDWVLVLYRAGASG